MVFLNDTVRCWVVCDSSFVFILSIIRVGSLFVVFVCLYGFCVGLVSVVFDRKKAMYDICRHIIYRCT